MDFRYIQLKFDLLSFYHFFKIKLSYNKILFQCILGEATLFDEGIRKHGKEFNEIQQEYVKLFLMPINILFSPIKQQQKFSAYKTAKNKRVFFQFHFFFEEEPLELD